MVKFHGERIGSNLMRKHFGWYIRGFESAGTIRKALVTASDKDEMVDILETIN
jgi:tRNA-dihydrouridine synthase B